MSTINASCSLSARVYIRYLPPRLRLSRVLSCQVITQRYYQPLIICLGTFNYAVDKSPYAHLVLCEEKLTFYPEYPCIFDDFIAIVGYKTVSVNKAV